MFEDSQVNGNAQGIGVAWDDRWSGVGNRVLIEAHGPENRSCVTGLPNAETHGTERGRTVHKPSLLVYMGSIRC